MVKNKINQIIIRAIPPGLALLYRYCPLTKLWYNLLCNVLCLMFYVLFSNVFCVTYTFLVILFCFIFRLYGSHLWFFRLFHCQEGNIFLLTLHFSFFSLSLSSISIKGSTIAKIWKGAKPVFLNFSNIRTLPPCHYDLRTLTLD